ncbi:hypothetical protein VTO42DRAFT_4524 [Malbranchea cinnamomea]
MKKKETEPEKRNKGRKVIRGRVTKPSAGVAQPSEKVGNAASSSELEIAHAENKTGLRENLHLEEAVKRKSYWTPVKDTFASTIDLTESPSGSGSSFRNRFGDLVSQYGFAGQSSLEGDSENGIQVPTKKRRLEPIGTRNREAISQASAKLSAAELDNDTTARLWLTENKKSQKPKTTTITSLTTAQFETPQLTTESNILGYFSPKRVDKGPAQKEKQRTKSSSTRQKGHLMKGTSPVFTVAPADDALRFLDEQVFVFGTSSQLEQDLSPGLEDCPGSTTQSSKGSDARASTVDSSSILSKLSGSRSLWSASSRDLSGDLADIEVVDLVNSNVSYTVRLSKDKAQATNSSENNIVDVVDLGQSRILGRSTTRGNELGAADTTIPPTEERNAQQHFPPSLSSSSSKFNGSRENDAKAPDIVVDLIGKDGSTPSSEASPSMSVSKEHGRVERPVITGDSMPHYRGFSSAELAKEVASFGFKPVKNREAAIALLEKCWESRKKMSNASRTVSSSSSGLSSAPSASEISTTSRTQSKPTKKTGSNSRKLQSGSARTGQSVKMKKAASTPLEPISLLSSSEEIADSTDEDMATNPSQDIYYDVLSYSNHLETIPSTTTPISSSSTSESIPDLSKQITLAIQAQPRLHAVNGLKQPTWYEKILMYDPIYIDDLTVWLNTEGFGLIGEDGEVDPFTVRNWCETKGVCCAWRKPRQQKH